jgi:hypothetical protein
MAVSTDYPAPVTVNGYSCRNCTDVDRAKKNIDPAHPEGGPFGVNASDKGDAPKANKRIFDRHKIEEAIRAAQNAALEKHKKTDGARLHPYSAGIATTETGQLLNLQA